MKVYAVNSSRGDCLVRASRKEKVYSYMLREYGRDANPVRIYDDKEIDRIKAMGAGTHEAG